MEILSKKEDTFIAKKFNDMKEYIFQFIFPKNTIQREARFSQFKHIMFFGLSVGMIYYYNEKIGKFFEIDPEELKKLIEM